MKAIYLKTGKEIIPGLNGIADVLDGRKVVPHALQSERSLELVAEAATLEDTDLKECGAGRMVRKTSERQSRWVIEAAVGGWQQAVATSPSEKTGLFLGLGVVDCEDDDQPLAFNGDLNDYANQMLTDTKPLAGLTLLNSTAASHIAQLLNITGTNAVFSPFADAGAQAISEAWFTIHEQKVEQALIAAGPQKITPWYFLTYRDMIRQWQFPGAFPTESAASIIASADADNAEGCLLAVKRAFVSQEANDFPALDELLSELSSRNIPLPQQVIFSGRFSLKGSQEKRLYDYLPGVKLCYLDRLTGFTGATGAIHAVNLAMAMHQRQQGISHIFSPASVRLNSETILVIAQGHHGQLCYLVVGGQHA
jgi:hypothetical protein